MRIHSFIDFKTIDGDDAYENTNITNAATVNLTKPTNPTIGGKRAPINSALVRFVGNSSSTLSQPIAWYKKSPSGAAAISEGIPIYNGDIIELYMSEVDNFEVIGADGNNQAMCVEYGYVGRQF